MRTQSVYFNPFTPIFENMAPGCIVVGSPGKGKTHFALTICRNVIMQRAHVIALDPKDDIKKICTIDEETRNVNLLEGYVMDPFLCIDNLDTNFIMSLIETICGKLTLDQKTDITPVVTDFVRRSKTNADTTFKKFTDYLYSSSNKNCMNIGNLLKSNEDSPIGSILFNNKGELMSIKNESAVFTLLGLPFPQNDKMDDWTQEERFASAIIMILVRMLKDVLKNNKETGIPTLLIIDEAHIIMANPAIYKIIEEFLILGRSLNIATMLLSQNVNHFPEDFSNYVSNKFIFGSARNNAAEFFRRFILNTNENIESLINFISKAASGKCVMIDRYGRVGVVNINPDLGITSNPFFK